MRRLLNVPFLWNVFGCFPPSGIVTHRFHRSHGSNAHLSSRHKSKKGHRRDRKRDDNTPRRDVKDAGSKVVTECRYTSESQNQREALMQRLGEPVGLLQHSGGTAAGRAVLAGRFSHRRSPPVGISAVPCPPLVTSSSSSQSCQQEKADRHALPDVSLNALQHLLNVHEAMRSNYETLGKSADVVRGFASACAEALLQLGLLQKGSRRTDTEPLDFVSVTLKTCGVTETSDSHPHSSLFVPRNSPLYSKPIRFPPITAESLFRIAMTPDSSPFTGGGDPLLAGLEGALPFAPPTYEPNVAAPAGAEGSNGSIDSALAQPHTALWSVNARGLGGLFSILLQRIPITDLAQFVDTLVYFKWVKDEEHPQWKAAGGILHELRALITTAKEASAATAGEADVAAAHRALEAAASSFLEHIPRVDVINERSVQEEEGAGSQVHAIDVMLNMVLRVCLSQWGSMTQHDRIGATLPCLYPWFMYDHGIEAGLWLTLTHLQGLFGVDTHLTYQHTFYYTRRLMRLCWPSICDINSPPVQKLLSSSADMHTAAEVEGDIDEGQQGRKRLVKKGEDATNCVVSFRDVVTVLHGSSLKQRAAYELLLIWMMRANPLGLHRSSPHGRYVSAAGITVADMDVFVMRRFHADHVKGNWALLRPVGVEGGLEGPEKALRQHCEVPYGLTRIFFTNFHNVLPHIWEGIGARRREILWTAWLRGVARPLVDAVAVSTAERRQYGEDMKHAAGSGGSTTESDEGALFFLKPLANVLTHNGLFLRFVMCSVIKSLEEMASGTRGRTNLSIGAWCNKLTEVVYSGALALCCMIGSSSSGGDANADPVLTGDKMEGKTTTPQACKGASREEAQRDLAVLQQHLSGAITRLLANLTTKDVAIVERLLRTLCELRLDSLCEEGMLRGILGQLAQLCNAQTCEPLYQWLEQQENSRSGAPEPLLEPLLCEWQRAASEADAGIPVRLPTVMECCRGVFGILKKRGYRLPDGAEGKQPPSEVQTGEEKTDDNSYEGRPIGIAFTKGELAVVINVFSRAIIGRTFVLDGVRVWRTISGEISTLVASRSDEKDTASSSGAGRTATESRAASDAVSVNASAAQRAVLLEGMLSRAVSQLMEELPWITVLEAVHLQLLPYTAAEVLFSCSKGVEGNEAEHIQWQDLQRSFQRKRHHRLVGKMVLFRFYSYLAPHDEGWSDATVLLRSASAEGRGRHISPPGAATWRLLKTLVECETAGVWGRRGNEAAVPAAKLSTDAEHGSDPVQGEELRLRQLDYVLGSHTLAAYIVLMASGKAPHMLRSAYETLLTLIEKAALTASPVSNNHCDLLFLWMVGSAVAVGVHFKEGVLTIKWPAASEGSVEDLQVCTSMEEGTARVVRLLEPHLQTEMMRPTVRLRSIINIVVALRTLVLLGAVVDVDSMHFEQLLIKAGSDKRLLVRHMNLFLVGCSAFPRTQPALLHTALYLREARQNLSIAETERALVAIALSADSFAKQHGLQADHTQQKQLNNAPSLTPVSGSGALTFRVTPIQLRHAWSALGRHVLECAEGSPTTVFVRALQCAAAVGCVDTVVYQQLLSYMVEFRQSELTLFDWVVILQTARQSLEHQRSLEAYLQEPLRSFLMEMSGGCDTVGEPKRQWCTRRECGSEQWLQELCLFAEALPELFIGDASLWELLWRALSAQWSACFSAAGSDEEKERISGWLQELTESYTWAVRTAGHHNLSEMCAV